MSFATRLAARSQQPRYLIRYDGDLVDADAFEATTGWSVADAGGGLTTSSTAKAGAASISFDKSGTGSTLGRCRNSSLEAVDYTAIGYETLWVYLSSVADVQSLFIRRGSDLTNYWTWRILAANLAAGWNELFLDIDEQGAEWTSFSQTNSPVTTAVDTLDVILQTNSSGNTLSGILVDALRQHPRSASTLFVTNPRENVAQGRLQGPPTITPHIYDPRTGQMGSASCSWSTVDEGGTEVLPDLSAFPMPGRGFTCLMGFADDAETADNYQAIFRGRVRTDRHIGRAWSYTGDDNLGRFRRPFMQDATDASPVTVTRSSVVDAFLEIACSTGNGNNGDYDTLSADRGAGISVDLFDIDAIEAARDDFMASDGCTFTFRSSQPSFFEWFLVEFCAGYGVIPVVLGNGKLSIRLVEEGVYPSASPATLDDTNTINTGALPQYGEDRERIYNQVRVRYDYDSADDEFDSDTGDDYQVEASITRYGLKERVVSSKGITSETVANRVARRWLAMLGDGSPPTKLEAFASELDIEQGQQVVQTSRAMIPDIEAGTYSTTERRAQVEGRGYNPATGRTTLVLGNTGYRAGNFRLIGPTTLTADYDSATATEQATYGFVSDGSDQLGAANDPTHVIGPG